VGVFALCGEPLNPFMTKKGSSSSSLSIRLFSRKFRKALDYAARVHARQIRKKTARPYIGHLLNVASLVIEYGGDEEMAIAALLHDAVEDQGGLPRLRDIRKKFGKRVAHIVDGCTDSVEHPKPPWLDRKRAYVSRIKNESSEVLLVSAADKLSNVRETLHDVRTQGERVFERFAGKKEGTLWYYHALVEEFRKRGSNVLFDELARAVTELESVSDRSPQFEPAQLAGAQRATIRADQT
jgi:(p)ppGpp synthase/HD superfamily hydrolase